MAGFAVGIVERDSIVDGPARTRIGDVLIGLPSPGLRSNSESVGIVVRRRPCSGFTGSTRLM